MKGNGRRGEPRQGSRNSHQGASGGTGRWAVAVREISHVVRDRVSKDLAELRGGKGLGEELGGAELDGLDGGGNRGAGGGNDCRCVGVITFERS